MNTYATKFFARCPTNGVRIEYALTIRSEAMIQVEDIIAAVSELTNGFHEKFADALAAQFGGNQTLVADHHGVTITTVRSGGVA